MEARAEELKYKENYGENRDLNIINFLMNRKQKLKNDC
jgi:hypothetical protein